MVAKVIHLVENLNCGAVESWLVRMLVFASQSGVKVDWTFYCALGQAGRLDDLARTAGAKIIYSPVPIRQKLKFIKALRTELRRGEYDVLHCHHDLISGLYLLAAIGLAIRKRIVHVHNADESVLTPNRLKELVLRPMLRKVCLRLADQIVGISNHTLDTFLVGRPRRPVKDIVHYYGIDPKPFADLRSEPIAFRRTLGLSDDSLILLFAGRVVPEKNPLFVLEVLAELIKREPRAVAVFAGAGSLGDAVQKKAVELGLSNSVRMLGFRSDVPAIMSCCDWFILPRPEKPKEGFGIAVVEAQLAGLRLLLSKGIPNDPMLPTASYQRLSLEDGASEWAHGAMQLLRCPVSGNHDAFTALSNSPMDMQTAMISLNALHR